MTKVLQTGAAQPGQKLTTVIPVRIKRSGGRSVDDPNRRWDGRRRQAPKHAMPVLTVLSRAFLLATLARRRAGGQRQRDRAARGLHPTTVNELLRLTLLSPAVVRALLASRQPRALSLIWLKNNEVPGHGTIRAVVPGAWTGSTLRRSPALTANHRAQVIHLSIGRASASHRSNGERGWADRKGGKVTRWPAAGTASPRTRASAGDPGKKKPGETPGFQNGGGAGEDRTPDLVICERRALPAELWPHVSGFRSWAVEGAHLSAWSGPLPSPLPSAAWPLWVGRGARGAARRAQSAPRSRWRAGRRSRRAGLGVGRARQQGRQRRRHGHGGADQRFDDAVELGRVRRGGDAPVAVLAGGAQRFQHRCTAQAVCGQWISPWRRWHALDGGAGWWRRPRRRHAARVAQLHAASAQPAQTLEVAGGAHVHGISQGGDAGLGRVVGAGEESRQHVVGVAGQHQATHRQAEVPHQHGGQGRCRDCRWAPRRAAACRGGRQCVSAAWA